jgi:hypothetical protein
MKDEGTYALVIISVKIRLIQNLICFKLPFLTSAERYRYMKKYIYLLQLDLWSVMWFNTQLFAAVIH